MNQTTTAGIFRTSLGEKEMKAKITDCGDNFKSYTVNSRKDCRGDTDKAVYDFLEMFPGDKCAKLGSVIAERI
tara:strand:- start:294 stop:512 length:219 start_codon:yes stop_codon:yes gene_type:complete